jgi:ATP-binding cassette, subfamily B, bacterial MsbA
MKHFYRILRYISRYKLLFTVSVFFSILYAVMNGFSIYLIGPFTKTIFKPETVVKSADSPLSSPDFFGSWKAGVKNAFDSFMGYGNPHEILTRLCYLIIFVIFLKNLFSYLQGYIMAHVEQGVVRDIREDVYASYHRLPLRFFQKRKTGEMISSVINDCNAINENLNSAFIDLIKEPINIAVLIGVMLVINWRLTIFTFLVAPPSLYIIMRIGQKLRKRTTTSQDRIAALTSVLEETISNIRVVKAFAMEQFELMKFNLANNAYFRSLIRLFRVRRLSSPVTEFLGVATVVFVLWIGGTMVLDHRGELDADKFIVFIAFMFMLMQAIKRLSDVNVKLQVGIAAAQRVFDVMDTKSDIVDPPDPLPIDTLRENIRFKNVWFEYEPGVPVLREIDLTVKAGETIAIVGSSGSGKSTLMDLLPRFFDPGEGAVEIDGNNLRKYKLDDLRHLFGIVTQETILFHDTIKANIGYGRPDISLDAIIAAAGTANAHDFIIEFEKGYDTVIGDRGTKLSGGQRQRIAIARAILKNPPILLFDEATSALDTKSEREVQTAIDKLMEGRTTFVIAHRLSTIQHASRIVLLEKGRIVRTGTHEELYEKEGIYRRMYDLQWQNIKNSK